MSDRKRTAEQETKDQDQGEALDINEPADADASAEKESGQPDEDLHSRSGDDYEGEAWQINENTKES